jgi:hypothetical protein
MATDGGYSWRWVFDRFLSEDPLTLTAGLAGIVLLWRDGTVEGSVSRRRAMAFGLWAVWGLIIAMPGGRGPAGLLVADLPLVLAAACLLGKLVTLAASGGIAQVRGAVPVIALLAAGYVWARVYRPGPFLFDFDRWLICVCAATAAIAIFLPKRLRFRKHLIFASMVVLLAAELRGSWELSRNIARQPVFFREIGHPDVRLLQSDMRHWVAHSATGNPTIQVRVGNDAAASLIRWYLRDFHEATAARRFESRGAENVVIRDGVSPRPGESPGAVRYRLSVRVPSTAEDLSSGFSRAQDSPKPHEREVYLLWSPRM